MTRQPFPLAAGFFGIFCLAAGAVFPQEPSLENLLPGIKGQALVLDIVARIVESDREEVWNSVNSKVTIPGRPVSLKLIGENIVVAAQFTPYLGEKGRNILVAQGQIWISVPGGSIQYQTTMQTIPLEYGEQIYFFPLGRVSPGETARIEIQLELKPYAALAEEGEGEAAAEPPAAVEAPPPHQP